MTPDDKDCLADSDDDSSEHDNEIELLPSSPLSSSPPQDFDVDTQDMQYMPIYTEEHYDDCEPHLIVQHASSSNSSITIDNTHNDRLHDRTNCANASKKIASDRVVQCPLCEKPMRNYCAKCVHTGHYVTVDNRSKDEKFVVIDLRKNTCDETTRTAEPIGYVNNPNTGQHQKATTNMAQEQRLLQDRLSSLETKTAALHNFYNAQKQKLAQTQKLLADTRQELDADIKSNRSKAGKIELIKKYITSRQSSVQKRRKAGEELLDEMRQHVQRRIFQLTNEVFPIEELNLLEQNSSFVNMETSPLLTFSDGSHHQIEQQSAYSIVEPWLSSNGDYSAYSLWVNDERHQLLGGVAADDTASERLNPALRISAGLTYVAQLVKNLASYLDVILPARIDVDSFNTVNNEHLDDATFSYNVAKLNADIIHLCVSQGIDVSLLQPQCTLKNLMLLFDLNLVDLGRKPIMQLDDEDHNERIRKLEEQLAGDLSHPDTFYDFSRFAANADDDDEDDVSDSDWDMSSAVNHMEMQLANEQSIQQNSYISRYPLRLLASFWSTGAG